VTARSMCCCAGAAHKAQSDAPDDLKADLALITDRIRIFIHHGMELGFQPLARALAGTGITPNHVTVAGTALTLVSAAVVVAGDLVWGGAIFIIAGTLDTLDGTLARIAGLASARGAFIDSTLDRVSEGAMFAALAYYFSVRGAPVDVAIVVVTLLGSVMVSYTRARADALGIDCSSGLATRGERVFVLGLGMIFGWPAIAIYVLAVTTAYTAVQRITTVLRALPAAAAEGESEKPAG